MTQNLDIEVTALLNELEVLREKNPVDDVGDVMEAFFDVQCDAEGKSWDARTAEYKQAIAAMAAAMQATHAAIADTGKTADAVAQARAALTAVQAAIAAA